MNRIRLDSPIDRHVRAVRRREIVLLGLHGVGLHVSVALGLASVGLLAGRLLSLHVPWAAPGLLALLAAAATLAVVRAWRHAPSPLDVAVRMDRVLGLAERLSTACLLREAGTSTAGETGRVAPAFAKAVLDDAERVAGQVQPLRHFPLRVPGPVWLALALTGLWATLYVAVPQRDLLGRAAARAERQQHVERVEQARQQVVRALELIDQQLPRLGGDAEVVRARAGLEQLLERPIADPASAQRSALAALQQLEDALQNRIRTSQAFAAAERDRRLLRQLAPAPGQDGPLAEARSAVAAGDFDAAIELLEQLTENFDKLSGEERAEYAEQMRQLALQLQQLAEPAGNPSQLARHMQQTLTEMGLGEGQAAQLAQQLAQRLAQADATGPQGPQPTLDELRQQAAEALQQLNNGQGPTEPQRQTIERLLAQAQQQAQGGSTPQKLAQAAARLAQAMQEAARSGEGPGPDARMNSGAGPSGTPSAGGGLEESLEHMRQQLRAMKAIQDDARAMASAAQAARDAAQAARAGAQGQGAGAGTTASAGATAGNPGRGGVPGSGQTTPGQASGAAGAAGWGGSGTSGRGLGGGVGEGDRSFKEVAPFTVRPERAPTQTDERGRVLASSFVRAGALRGEATEELKEVTRAAEQQAAEEVDTERVGRAAQRVVRQYFNALTGQR